MFIRYVEGEYEGKAVALNREEMDYMCCIIPITMASVFNQKVSGNWDGFLDYDKNPVCLNGIQIKGFRYILFDGNSIEELAKSTDFFGLPFNIEKVCVD